MTHRSNDHPNPSPSVESNATQVTDVELEPTDPEEMDDIITTRTKQAQDVASDHMVNNICSAMSYYEIGLSEHYDVDQNELGSDFLSLIRDATRAKNDVDRILTSHESHFIAPAGLRWNVTDLKRWRRQRPALSLC